MTEWATAAASRQEEWLGLAAMVDVDSGPGDTEGFGASTTFSRGAGGAGIRLSAPPTAGPDVLVARRPEEGSPRLALIGHARL